MIDLKKYSLQHKGRSLYYSAHPNLKKLSHPKKWNFFNLNKFLTKKNGLLEQCDSDIYLTFKEQRITKN